MNEPPAPTHTLSTAAVPTAVPAPILRLTKCVIRPYHPTDAAAVALAANHPEIARNMRNTFPSPYTLRDAEAWLSTASPLNFAILARRGARDDDDSPDDPDDSGPLLLAGGIGLRRLSDVESRTMEVGYWLGREYWGRGIAGDALRGFSRWAFATVPDLLRLEACVFGPNARSAALLASAGYTFEGTRRKAVVKDGVVMDMLMFSLLTEECPGLDGGGEVVVEEG